MVKSILISIGVTAAHFALDEAVEVRILDGKREKTGRKVPRVA